MPLYDRDPEAWNAYLAEGNRTQARKRVSVDAIVRDGAGRILIVRPNYKPGWDLPGGMVEANEPPLDALRRELAEELGLRLAGFTLLVVDWVPPHGPWDDQLAFIFDAGRLEDDVRLSAGDEIEEFRFVEAGQLADLLRGRVGPRAVAALAVLRAGGPVRYLHDGRSV